MSTSPPNYIDGLPVKISEKYKPPPKISLPQKLIQSLNNCAIAAETNSWTDSTSKLYDFQLERNVLSKISEWKNVRQQERFNRRERMQKRQQECQKQLEEKQKQLLTAVSYPSAEDLSSDQEDEEEEDEINTDTLEQHNNADETPSPPDNQSLTAQEIRYTCTPNRFDDILQPTIIPGQRRINMQNNPFYNSILETTSPISTTTPISSLNATHNLTEDISNLNTNFSKINYSDFENDTSSPFDNIELKTINDLDILAQVLNLNISPQITDTIKPTEEETIHSNKNVTDEMARGGRNINTSDVTTTTIPYNYQTNSKTEETNVINENITNIHQQQPNHPIHHQAPNENSFNVHSNLYQQQQQQQQHHQHIQHHRQQPQMQQQQSFQHQQPNYAVYNQLANQTNFNQYASNFNQIDEIYYNYNRQIMGQRDLSNSDHVSNTQQQPPITSQHQQINQQNYYYTYNNHSNQNYAAAYGVYNNGALGGIGTGSVMENYQKMPYEHILQQSPVMLSPTVTTTLAEKKLKSKSVPDILKELNDELADSEMKRTRNNSQSISSPIDDYENLSVVRKQPTEDLSRKLSISSQKLIKNISSMGFPLDRVTRIAEKFGKDDKKIVEHLIPLSELLDLGFDESKISDALIKFNNNKDKALDFLIS